MFDHIQRKSYFTDEQILKTKTGKKYLTKLRGNPVLFTDEEIPNLKEGKYLTKLQENAVFLPTSKSQI